MSIPAAIAPAIMDTILDRLALLFLIGAAGDPTAARHAARQMLAAYNPQTPDEVSLAAEIISFSFHALEALAQAAEADQSINRILRFRGSAVSLSREAHKFQRKLDQLQRARHAGIPPQPAEIQPEPTPTGPTTQPAPNLIEAERDARKIIARDGGGTWSQSLHKRLAAKRMADKIKKNQAQQASQAARLTPQAAPQNTIDSPHPPIYT